MDWPRADDLPEAARKLGELRAVFRAKRGLIVLCWVFGGLALLLGLAAVAGGLAVLGHGRGRGIRFLFTLGAGALVAGVRLLRKANQAAGQRVYVGADGLADARGDTVEILRWDEIHAVKRQRQAKNSWLVLASPTQLVVAGSDRQFTFDETVAGLGELRRLVEEHTLSLMLPPTVTAFDTGTPLRFGEVSVSRDGLSCDGEELSWDSFERADVSGRWLGFYSDGNSLFGRVDVAKVPNVHVLLALAERARGRR